jgi:predicted esterase
MIRAFIASPNEEMTALASETSVTRREALRLAAIAASAIAVGCRPAPASDGVRTAPGRLTSRPAAPSDSAQPGLSALGLGSGRDGLVFIPAGYRRSSPAPLVLMLHGAGQSAEIGIRPFLSLADAAGLVLLVPDSRERTWDFLYGAYGADVAFIDRALAKIFDRCAIDPARVTIEGFSDGASYALSLGVVNGDLFSRIIAFSPCIFAPTATVGRPRIFISHGTADRILPIDRCGRRLAAQLSNAGYAVSYHEFAGPHTVTPEIARDAVRWVEAGD